MREGFSREVSTAVCREGRSGATRDFPALLLTERLKFEHFPPSSLREPTITIIAPRAATHRCGPDRRTSRICARNVLPPSLGKPNRARPAPRVHVTSKRRPYVGARLKAPSFNFIPFYRARRSLRVPSPIAIVRYVTTGVCVCVCVCVCAATQTIRAIVQ